MIYATILCIVFGHGDIYMIKKWADPCFRHCEHGKAIHPIYIPEKAGLLRRLRLLTMTNETYDFNPSIGLVVGIGTAYFFRTITGWRIEA